jgi:hypothetical protein
MKLLSRLLLAMALLLQGQMAVAMSFEAPAAKAPAAGAVAAMPCHDTFKPALPCCSDRFDCMAMCAAAAVPVTVAFVLSVAPEHPVATLVRSEQLPPHRYTPLRPPIAHSA